MTAKTAASHVGPTICVSRNYKAEWGELADAYYPGTLVYESAAGIWTAVTTGVGQLNRVGIVGFKARVDTSFARKDIDDAYTAGDSVEIIGTGVCTARILDQNGALLRGVRLTYSASAGIMTVMAATEICLATVHEPVADNDTYLRVRLEGTGWRD